MFVHKAAQKGRVGGPARLSSRPRQRWEGKGWASGWDDLCSELNISEIRVVVFKLKSIDLYYFLTLYV